MIGKRVAWFGVGVVTGAAGTVYGYVRAREAARVRPDEVADALVGAARTVGGGVRDLVEDSRVAIREAEDELRLSLAQRREAGAGPPAPTEVLEVGVAVPLEAGRAAARNRRRRARRRSLG